MTEAEAITVILLLWIKVFCAAGLIIAAGALATAALRRN